MSQELLRRQVDTVLHKAHEAWRKPQVRKRIGAFGAVLVLFGLVVSLFANFYPNTTQAAPTFEIQTGYYMGDGNARSIKGLGWAPELVVIKSDSNTVATIWKSVAMPENTVQYLGAATAGSTAGWIELKEDGFTVMGTANTVNIRYTWTAFKGNDCSSSGSMCLGRYVGTGANANIPTGFQPDVVWVKRSTAVRANWVSSSMAGGYTNFFAATAQDTTAGTYYANPAFGSTYFTVAGTGTSGNAVSGGTYYFAAFKNLANKIKTGTYTAPATPTDNTNITGVGFRPNYIFVKTAAALAAVSNCDESYGDNASYFSATANLVNSIQALQSDGFQVGTDTTVQSASTAHYYLAFGGAQANSSGSGTFKMATGTYTGVGSTNGAPPAIGNLGFAPDLVIIKGNTTQAGVFRTSHMGGDSTAYLDSATANFAAGITALNGDGFSIGTSDIVNTNGVTYHWAAYGNAWTPESNDGAADFYIGTYYVPGTAIDNRNITRLPFQADMVTIKRGGATAATYRTSAMSGDLSGFFAASAEAANNIQSLNSDGFQIGTSANVASISGLQYYFGFKNGPGFTVGTYSGNAGSQDITTTGTSGAFQPDYLWVKQTGATRGVEKFNTMAAANSAPFINVAEINNAFTGFISTGFRFTSITAAETNASGTNNYRYVAWKKNTTQAAPTFEIQTGYYMGDGNARSIKGLGWAPELVVIKSDSNTVATIWKSVAMPENTVQYLGAATAGSTAGWIELKEDGFTVMGTANTVNIRYTWTAFKGNDCSSSGSMCLGRYVGTGANANIPTGFQPDVVWVKRSTAVRANWVSSSMAGGYTNFFAATAQDTTAGTYYANPAFGSTYFTVAGTGTSGNAVSGGTYYFAAFKNLANKIKTGTYTAPATPTDNTNITGVGFRPNYIFVKTAAALAAVSNCDESYGDNASYFSATANLVNSIQALQSDGFQVGTDTTVQSASTAHYYLAFGGAQANSSGSGTFKMATGTYTGVGSTNGAPPAIGNLGFAPDLVIIKGNTTQAGVFRTSHMGGDSTAYLDSATANFAAGITALNGDGFSIGTSDIVNTNGVTYHWAAYGNAWTPESNDGAADFYIGTYYVPGTAIDNRNITRLPFQADMVTIKRGGATAATYRTSAMSGDLSGFFAASAEAANNIQSLNSDGFQIGTSANVASISGLQYYFGFKNGPGFTVGTYSGNAGSQDITTTGTSGAFQPDYLWVKQTGATRGVEKFNTMAAANSAPFINVAEINNAFTGFISTGFRFTSITAAETNASGTNNYRYVAWKKNTGIIITFGQTGTQTANMAIPSSSNYIGAAFTIVTDQSNVNVISITITETGTVNANANLSNLVLRYETAGTCTYDGTETIFGSSSSFDTNEKATIAGNLYVSTSQVCIYAILNVGSGALNNESLDLEVTNPVSDIVTNGGITSPPSIIALFGSTTLQAAGISISGTCNQWDQISDCVDDGTNAITVAFGNVVQAQTDATVDGAWQISGLTAPAANTVITIFINGESTASERAVAVTKYNGSGNISGVALYQRHLVIGSNQNNTISNSELATYDYSASGNDVDVIFDVDASNNLTLDNLGNYSDERLTILSGNTYRPDSGASRNINTNNFQNLGTVTTDSSRFYVSGNWANSGTFTTTTGGVTFNGTTSYNDTAATKQNIGVAILNGTSVTLASSMTLNTLSITAGTFNMASSGYTLKISGTGSAATVFSSSGTFNPGTNSLVQYEAVNSGGNVNVATVPYNNLEFAPASSETYAMQGNLTSSNAITGNLTIGANVTLDTVSGSSYNITLAGNWTNNGSLVANSSTVTLNGGAGSTQIISGNTTFYNLYATTTSARAINFASGSTTTVTGTWTATGTAGQHLSLGRYGGSGTDQWNINPTAWNVDYVTPSNSKNQAASPINPTNYTDGGNNTNWFASNAAPNNPSSLAQKKTDDTIINTGSWINATSVKFTATASDTNNPDTLYLCVEKDILGTSFSNTEDLCGSGVAYSGSPVTVTVTITGITDASEYHWQARVKDAAGAYSSWVSYGGNAESERDFGIDTTAPTGATIYDGNDGSQHDYNDYNTGSLTALSAYWVNTAPNFNVSGATTTNTYQYAIGTTQGGTDIRTWTYTGTNGTDKFVNATGLVLQTGVKYYFSVRAYDNAGNMATFYSSGQQVYPTLSFSVSANTVTFDNLNNVNNWTNTKTTTVTTSTNAVGGYTVKAYTSDFLRSLAYGSIYINAFAGTWTAPQNWANFCKDDTNDCGFGYGSNDDSVSGSNRFAVSGGIPTNFAAYSQTSPGDVVADHTAAVNGTTGAVTNEQFIITHKVSVAPSQAASIYRTLLTLIVTANF